MVKKIKKWWSKKGKGFRISFITLLLVVLAVRIALPFVTKYYVLKTLNDEPDFSATLEDVDYHLYRGAVVFQGLKIYNTTSGKSEPLFLVENIDASVQWSEIFNGALVGEIYMTAPYLNFAVGLETDSTETQNNFENIEEMSWQEELQGLLPITLNKFVITNGEVHYKDFATEPQLDLMMNNIQVELRNLTNSTSENGTLVSTGEISADVLGSASLDIEIKMDPYDETGTFDVNINLEKLDMVKLNGFARAYASVDIEKGQFSLYSEIGAKKGQITGYVKPVADDLKILSLKNDNEGILNTFWQGVAGFGTTLFSNIPNDKMGAKVEFDGSIEKVDINIFKSFGSLLSNMFFNTLTREVDHDVNMNLDSEDSSLKVKNDEKKDEDKGFFKKLFKKDDDK